MLADLVGTALDAAEASGGLVDPTVGVRRRGARLRPEHRAARRPTAPRYASSTTSPGGAGSSCTATSSSCPRDVRLDLGATAKARAADLTRPTRRRDRRGRRAGRARRRHRDRRARAGRRLAGAGPGHPRRPAVPGVAGRRLGARDVVDGQAHLAPRRRTAPPHRRPAHRRSGRAGVAQRHRHRTHLRRGQHRLHRGRRPGPGGRGAGWGSAASPPAWSTSGGASSGSATGRRWRHEHRSGPGAVGTRPGRRRGRARHVHPLARARHRGSLGPAAAGPGQVRHQRPAPDGRPDGHRARRRPPRQPALRPLRPAAAGGPRPAVPGLVPPPLAGAGHARRRHAGRRHRRVAAAAPGRAPDVPPGPLGDVRPLAGRPAALARQRDRCRRALVPHPRRGLRRRRARALVGWRLTPSYAGRGWARRPRRVA